MPTLQKAFIIHNIHKAGEVESADFVVGNIDAADALNIVSMLRDGSTEQQLQQETQASHGELSRELARLWAENMKLENKLAQVPHDLKLLTMLCCERVTVNYRLHNDYIGSVEFFPKSIELHGSPTICGVTGGGNIRRFTTDEIVSFTALPSDAPHDNMPSS